MDVYMKEKKRIKILQRIVEQLQIEKQQLLNENRKLQDEIALEKNKQKEGQENQKQLEVNLQRYIDEYLQLISDARLIKSKYETETDKLRKIKNKYNKKMKATIKSIKKDF